MSRITQDRRFCSLYVTTEFDKVRGGSASTANVYARDGWAFAVFSPMSFAIDHTIQEQLRESLLLDIIGPKTRLVMSSQDAYDTYQKFSPILALRY